jgi:hypothetical protein
MRSPWANPTDRRPEEFLGGEHGWKGETMDEPEFRDLERHREDLLDASYGDDPLTGRCARCEHWWDEHPGGFCPDAVYPDGTVDVGPAPVFEPIEPGEK